MYEQTNHMRKPDFYAEHLCWSEQVLRPYERQVQPYQVLRIYQEEPQVSKQQQLDV